MINIMKTPASMMLNPQQQAQKQKKMLFMLAAFSVILLAIFLPDIANATDGKPVTSVTGAIGKVGEETDAFGSIWQQLAGWIQGTLGKIIVGSMILVGIIMGVVRQSIMAFAVGVGAGIGLYNMPTLIDGLLKGASAEAVNAATIAAQAINNGLLPF